MQIDPALNSHANNYKLLTNLVVPRPIAWVSSLGPDGVINLARFLSAPGWASMDYYFDA